ncbi:hypothetical protein [Nonomuraea sp. NPDC050691]|uniref:hypothetical protein n=1 Tax=Nonomuraea sp. NPDC050691 TaxID=3155661 RepID=UPI0033E32894
MRLRELHALAGSPSLSELCRLSRSNKACMELRKSTVSDVLTGKRKRAPKWTFVHSFVTTCAMAAEQGGLDVRSMGDIQAWYACWRAAHDAAALSPAPAAALSGATALAVPPPAAILSPPATVLASPHATVLASPPATVLTSPPTTDLASPPQQVPEYPPQTVQEHASRPAQEYMPQAGPEFASRPVQEYALRTVPELVSRPVDELASAVVAECAVVAKCAPSPTAAGSGVLPWRPRRAVPGDPAGGLEGRERPEAQERSRPSEQANQAERLELTEGGERTERPERPEPERPEHERPAPGRPAPGQPAPEWRERVAGEGAEIVEPVSGEERELLRIYGRTGLRLLRESDPADGRDCMRLAVVTLLRNHPDVARDWLRRAGDAGRHEATELFNHPRPEDRAAGHAYLHGIGYQEAEPPRLSYAMFFFRLAAARGHAGAAFRLAKAHRANRENRTAEKWLRRAAEGGDPLAASVLDGARTAAGGIDPGLLAELLDRIPVPATPQA